MYIRMFTIFSCVLLVSCSATTASPSKSTLSYSAPKSYHIQNTLSLNESFDDVWHKLVANLSGTDFTLNKVDKDSHIIKVSFLADANTDIVDCGTLHKALHQAESQASPFLAQSSSLSGIANIYFRESNNYTLLSIDVNYSIEGQSTSLNTVNNTMNEQAPLNLSTAQGYYNGNANGISCSATGKLESKILALVKLNDISQHAP